MCHREDCRHVIIGDMIIEHHPETDNKWIGIVVGDITMKLHQDRIQIGWISGCPPNYKDEFGYNTTNIHNLRERFEIHKKRT